MERGGSMESGASVSSRELEASVTGNMGGSASANAKERATVNAEARAAVKAEERTTVIVEARKTVKAEDRATVNAEDRSTVNAEARTTVKAEAHSAANAEGRSSLIVEAPTTVKAEDRTAVNAEARPTVNASERSTVNAEDRATANVEARTTVKTEDRATVSAGARATVKAEDFPTTVNAEDRATGIVEAGAIVKAEDRATVNAKDRTPVNTEDRATVSVEDRSAVNAEDRATVIVEAPAIAKAENRAAVNAEARATINAEHRAAANAEDRATVKVEDGANAKAEHRAAVNAEALATVSAEDRATVNAKPRATVNVEDRATVIVEAPTTFKAEDRATVTVEARTTINADYRATVKVEALATVNAEDGATVSAEDSAAYAAASSARSPAQYRLLHSVRTERRKDVPDLSRWDPERNTWAVATCWRNSERLLRLPEYHAAEVERKLYDEVTAIDEELRVCRMSFLQGVCTAGAGLALIRQREEELLARREDALALARMDVQEMLREVGKRNRAKRMAVRLIYRRPRHAVIESAVLREAMDDIAARLLGVPDSCEDSTKTVRARRELAGALAAMDRQERAREIARMFRAKRIAARVLHRHPRGAADDLKKAAMKPQTDMDVIAAGILHGLDSAEVSQDGVRARRELARALTGIDPQEPAREIARRNRAKRIALRLLPRQWRRAADDFKKVEMKPQTNMDVVAARILRGLDSAEDSQEGIRARRELARALTEMNPQERAREIARMFRASRAAACVIQRQRRTVQARERAKLIEARYSDKMFRQQNQRLKTAAERTRARGREEDDLDSDEARQEDLPATREHPHARSLAETDHPQEIQGEASCSDLGVPVEVRLDQVDGRRVTADEASATSETQKKLQTNGQALVDGVRTGEMELQTSGTELVDGIGTGQVEPRAGGSERVDGIETGQVGPRAGGSERVDGMGAGEVELQPDGVARSDSTGTGEGDGKAAVLGGIGTGEVDGREAVGGGIRTGEVNGKAAVVDDTGAGGFPLFDESTLEEFRAKAVAEAAARAVRYAVAVNRKTDLTRARQAEKARRQAKKQEKMERSSSRDARRFKKLQDRESRAHSQPGAEGENESSQEESSEEESSEEESDDAEEIAEEITEKIAEEVAEEIIFRGGKRRGLAVVDGGGSGSEGGGGGSADAVAGANNLPAYDYTERATRFESSFAEADAENANNAVPVTILPDKASFELWLGSQTAQSKSRINNLGHDSHKAARVIMVRSAVTEGGGGGTLTEVAVCTGEGEDSLQYPFSLCSLREKLPAGTYALRGPNGDLPKPDAAALSWALGSYSFDRYKSKSGSEASAEAGVKESEPEGGESKETGVKKSEAEGGESKEALEAAVEEKVLAWPGGGDRHKVSATAASTFLVRDLISTQSEDMGPQHLEDVMASLSKEFHGNVRSVKGDALLKEGDSYPMIHAIGCAAVPGREPRLLDLTWTPPNSEGNPNLPKVTLVGKGVCFDTGGLDPKPAAGTLTMKKDMGGGAQVLGLARMIMAQELPVRLRVLVPAVEVAIGGDDEFKPGCVLVARDGTKSKIGSTENAEGLLVLADALVEASSESPDLIIDCATLTGAARVALGTEISAFFCKDEEVAAKMHSLSGIVFDQVWRRPLWDGYPKQLSSKAVCLRATGGGYGGAVSAALYLDEFVGKKAPAEPQEGVSRGGGGGGGEKLPWIHMDFMGFNQASRPGRPEGGEAQGMRALFALLEDMFEA